MRKVIALSIGDVRNITRDFMLLLTIFTPVILTVVIRFGLPWVEEISMSELGFDLSNHYPFIMSIILLLTPMMLGMLVGFLILDERDENVLIYYSVTPLSKSGYLMYRLSSPVILGFFSTFFIIKFTGLIELNIIWHTLVILMSALGAPVIALIMGVFAKNKVEGLAISKMASFMVIAPIIGYVIPSNWQWLAGVFPPYWVTKSLWASVEPNLLYWFYVIGGLLVHSICIVFLLKRFNHVSI